MAAPDDLHERLLALSAQTLEVGPDQLTAEALLNDDLGIDSLAAIEWGMTIEDAFGVVIPEQAWVDVTTYGAVEDLVRRQLAGV